MPDKVTKAESQQLAEQLKAVMKKHGYSQKAVAQIINISPSQINRWLNGRYDHQGEISIIKRVTNLIDTIDRKSRHGGGPDFVHTAVAKHIWAIIKQTETFSNREGKIGIIIGDGGHGKSICLQQYNHVNPNSVYVELDDVMTSSAMFAAICEELGLDSTGSAARSTRHLIRNLRPRQVAVLLDEASGLTVKKLDQLRQIITVKCRCPLILAGNQDLRKTVMQPTRRRGYEALDQFTSRLSYILNLDELADSDGSDVYTAEDIRNLYEYGGIKLTADAVATLKRICRCGRSGRLRTCSNIIGALHTSKRVKDAGRISSTEIVAVIRQLGLPVRVWLPVSVTEAGDRAGEASVAKAG